MNLINHNKINELFKCLKILEEKLNKKLQNQLRIIFFQFVKFQKDLKIID